MHEVGRRCTGSTSFRSVRFGIGVRDDGLGGDLFAVREHHACGRAVLYANLDDFGAGANLRAEPAGRRGHGLRDRAHAARGKVTPSPRDAVSPPRESAAPGCCPPTTGRGRFRRFRARRSWRAAVRSRTIPPTRSATAIGPQRSRRYISFLPSLRMRRPVLSMLQRSPRAGIVDVGRRRSASASPMTLAILPSELLELGIASRRPSCENVADFLRPTCSDVVIEHERAAVGRQRDHADFGRDQLSARASRVACRERCRDGSVRRSARASDSGSRDGIRR